jgi:thioredoxin reductase (NADPH)
MFAWPNGRAPCRWLVSDIVTRVDLSPAPYLVECIRGARYIADTLIICTGAQARWLGLASETKFRGFGVSACRHLRRLFFRGR